MTSELDVTGIRSAIDAFGIADLPLPHSKNEGVKPVSVAHELDCLVTRKVV